MDDLDPFKSLRLDEMFFEADSLIVQKKISDAVNLLEAILNYLNISVVLSHLGKWHDLEQILNGALVVPGVDKATIYNEFGIMNELQGKFEEAINYYKTAIRFSLADATIDTYYASTKRCIKKQEMLG